MGKREGEKVCVKIARTDRFRKCVWHTMCETGAPEVHA